MEWRKDDSQPMLILFLTTHSSIHWGLLNKISPTYQSGSFLYLEAEKMPDQVDEHGSIISDVAKPRLKWTHELHQRFVEAVSQLGGADKATPKSVLRVMGIPGITLYHLKSHLQKYRLSKSSRDHQEKNTEEDTMEADFRETENTIPRRANENKPLFQLDSSASILQIQMDVQRRLQEQIQVQKHLQLRIEAQGKYLQSVLRKAQETIAGYNLISSENDAFKTEQAANATDCSTDSCLTSSGLLNGKQHCYNDVERSDCSENWTRSKDAEVESGDDGYMEEKRRRIIVGRTEHIEIDLNR